MGMYAGFDQPVPGPMMGPQGPPPPPGPPPGYDQGASAEDSLRECISQIRAVAEQGGMSEQERMLVEDVTSKIQKILALREKEDQALAGGGPATNALARAYGGG